MSGEEVVDVANLGQKEDDPVVSGQYTGKIHRKDSGYNIVYQ